MFGPFASPAHKLRKDAANWLHLAGKVLHYRRDQLNPAEIALLQQAREEVRQRRRNRSEPEKLKLALENLEGHLRKVGGTFYPKSSLVENVEFFLVALILFLGIRTYMIQPFKIPTNSMWPSYYGMTAEVFAPQAKEPGVIHRGARLVFLGATRRSADAPAAGSVALPFIRVGADTFMPARDIVRGRTWGIFPTLVESYPIYVDNRIAAISVPLQFQMDDVLREAFFPEFNNLSEAVRAQIQRNRAREGRITLSDGQRSGTFPVLLVDTGQSVQAGERLLSFDVLTGDQLFVDRMSYHFVRPKVGQGFVFRTRGIPGLAQDGVPDDKYYIKRLVGLPGDRLSIEEPVLLRNGEPISGSKAFSANAARKPPFRGYRALDLLAPGRQFHVPGDAFFTLGDNSNNSLDSRMWGSVPRQDVVGRPILIYYPFSSRWGPAR